MQGNRLMILAERFCLILLLAWLVWLPLPFGSVIERARLPLVAVPLALCAAAAALRFYANRTRERGRDMTRPGVIWGTGGLLLAATGALQLLPLPAGLHRWLAPDSWIVWSASSRIAALAGFPARAVYPLTVDPYATRIEVFRIAALVATLVATALLVRTQERRIALAGVLCAIATFEALYGVREAALQRYEIWGWVNRLIFNRVTGTFVNPNHFAHYIAIILPMAFFLVGSAWRLTEGPERLPQRLALLIERHFLLAGGGVLAAAACIAGMLLAQSRGALLALVAGLLAVAALVPGRRFTRVAASAGGALALVAALVVFLGPERTVTRFIPNAMEQQTLVGRRIGISTAIALWQRSPVVGSGLGTFVDVVSMEQRQDLEKLYRHAHNDYAEIAATAGTLGFVIVFVALAGGYVLFVRMTFGRASEELSSRRRAYQVAALASLTIAMVHALFDFNFFIPANPATLAAIVGAAVASVDHDKRTRR